MYICNNNIYVLYIFLYAWLWDHLRTLIEMKLKACTPKEELNFLLGRVDNIVEKLENAVASIFSFSISVIKSVPEMLNVGIVW